MTYHIKRLNLETIANIKVTHEMFCWKWHQLRHFTHPCVPSLPVLYSHFYINSFPPTWVSTHIIFLHLRPLQHKCNHPDITAGTNIPLCNQQAISCMQLLRYKGFQPMQTNAAWISPHNKQLKGLFQVFTCWFSMSVILSKTTSSVFAKWFNSPSEASHR